MKRSASPQKMQKHIKAHFETARRIVQVMDIQFSLFGIRFGMDPLLDVIPGFGNTASIIVSLYLFWVAYLLRVPFGVYARMIGNIGFDYLIGFVPLIGIVVDVFFRANVKNFSILEAYYERVKTEG